ncbi:MAG: DUF971 domain-containing protein [Gammaproteobacteria bacterium]|nr:DUF971 domain-containing protein [Gammaproteobacteria bacterium]
MSVNKVIPTEITLHKQKRVLEICFDDGAHFELPCEYLRVHSPSAEVRGHGVGQETLQTGKEQVNINEIQPVGRYAVKLCFDDGHDSGIYSWETLYDLGSHYDDYWQSYLNKLQQAGFGRHEAEQQI